MSQELSVENSNSGIPPNYDTETRKIVYPGTHDETIEYAINQIISIGKEAIDARNGFFLALSGGSTPKKIYEKLTSSPYKEKLDWNRVHLFFGDERSCPPDDNESNYKMAMDAGFAKVGIPPSQIHRMVAEKDIEKNAEAYEALIRKRIPDEVFDLIMLGMGNDGHTASLFPGTTALTVLDKLVVANNVPQKATTRMSITYPLINKARNITFYCLGSGKKEILKKVFTDHDKRYPSSSVGTKHTPAFFLVDDQAK